MDDYYLDNMCLPPQGTLVLNGIKAAYHIEHGSQSRIGRNFHYVANGTGHGLNLDKGPDKALNLVQEAKHHGKAIAARYRVQRNNESAGSLYDGHYLLLDLSMDPQRPALTRKVILFVVHEGSTFQHYQSNVMKTDEEVLAAFEELRRVNHATHAA